MSKKILFITGEFLPNTSSVGGVIRVISFLKSLKDHKVKLISLKRKKYGYLGFKKYVNHVDKIYIDSGSINNNLNYNFFVRAFKRIFSNFFYLIAIDNNFFHLQKYKTKIIKEIRLFRPDYVIISAPPFSLFRLVNTIKKKFENIKIILDYRDGWTQRIESVFMFPFRILMSRYEKNILNKSNYILCATSKIFKDLSSLLNKKKIILLNNGYFKLNTKKLKKDTNSNKIKIGYFGLISDSRNSFRDLNVIHKSIQNEKKITFTFYGNSVINDKSILNCKKFKFKKNISYFDALKKMKEFDYLLILHTERSTAKEVVTGKFYEYVSSGIPIIFVSNGETEAGKLIKKHNLGFFVDYSKYPLDIFFKKLNKKKKNFKPFKNIKQFSREEQNKKLLKIIE